MKYYNEIKSEDRKTAIIFVAGYLAILVVAVLFVTFTVKDSFTEYPPKQGILVALGDMQEGRGAELLQKTKTPITETTVAATQPNSEPNAPKQNIPNPSKTPSQTKDNDAAEDAVLKSSAAASKPKPTVNKSALYSANNGSTATSIGEKSGKGTMGSTQGSQDSDNHTITDGFSLDGRSIVGSLPRPGYVTNNEGRVVVDIKVDKDGYVTSATFRAGSSTTNDNRLVAEAIAAAKKARFNVDQNANVIQAGTITYIFKVK